MFHANAVEIQFAEKRVSFPIYDTYHIMGLHIHSQDGCSRVSSEQEPINTIQSQSA